MTSRGTGSVAIVCDVTEPDPGPPDGEEVMQRFGRIDILSSTAPGTGSAE